MTNTIARHTISNSAITFHMASYKCLDVFMHVVKHAGKREEGGGGGEEWSLKDCLFNCWV